MKVKRLIIWISIITLLAVPLQNASGDPPWGEIFNPDGTVQWSKLTDLGTTSEKANWMDITLPGGMVIKLDATYHRYQTPSGNILVLPSPATLFFMAIHPNESGLSNAQSILGDGASILVRLLGPSLTTDQLAKLVTKGFTDPKAFFQAVIDGRENIWSIINANFFFEMLKMSNDSGFMVNALLLYLNGVTNCAKLPGGCAGLLTHCPGGNCIPQPSACPAPTIAQGSPTLSIQKIAPDHPLVVGQDPAKRGADIQAAVTIPPVVFTWYEQIQDPPTCRYDGSGNGHGCSGPGNRYAGVFDESSSRISWSASMEGDPSWKVVDGQIKCIQHVEVLPEVIRSVQAKAELNPESRYWILNDLAGKYYEAYVHQPQINLVPELARMDGLCAADHTCSAKALASRAPFSDPGTFDLRMWVNTTGTTFTWNGTAIPITQPRVLYVENTTQIYVTLVTLLPAGAH
jgi:hypothetical protein